MKRYYRSSFETFTSQITGRIGFRPLVFKYGDSAMLDFRPNISLVDGWCIAVCDTPLPVSATGIVLLTDGLDITSNALRNSLSSLTGRTITSRTIRSILVELLITKYSNIFMPPIRPSRDGKIRLYLGERIYGDAETVYQKGTFTDDFNRANSASLGTNWTELDGNVNISSNRAIAVTNGDTNLAVTAAGASGRPTTDDHYSQAKWYQSPDTGAGISMWARIADKDNAYIFTSAEGDARWYLTRLVDGNETVIATQITGWVTANGQAARLEVDGSALTGKLDGVSKITATDATITGNVTTGFGAYNDGHTWDDFETADLGGAPPAAVPLKIANRIIWVGA
jgi:hypothetical protein